MREGVCSARGIWELSVLFKFAGTLGILRQAVETVKLSVVSRDWQEKGNEQAESSQGREIHGLS